MFHDGVVCVAPDGIVACPVTVEAEQDQIRLRQINGEGAVGHDVDQRKPIFLASTTRSRTVRARHATGRSLPAEEQDAHPHMVEELHLPADLFIGMVHRCQIVDRAVPALQIAPVQTITVPRMGFFSRRRMVLTPKAAKCRNEESFILSPPLQSARRTACPQPV